MAIEYKLVPLNSKLIKEGGYRAVVDNDGYVKDMDDILAETSDRFGLKAPQLKMCMEAVLDTMIKKVAQDGIRRRFGNYFTLRLDIKGRFDGKDSKPDGSQRPCFKLQMLSAFKEAARKIQLVNEVKRTRIYVDHVLSFARPVKGVVFWGLELNFGGKNLGPVCDGDHVDWSFTDAHGERHTGTCGAPYCHEEMRNLRMPFNFTLGKWPEDMPRSAIGREVTFTYYSRGGDPFAEMQVHSASAVVREG